MPFYDVSFSTFQRMINTSASFYSSDENTLATASAALISGEVLS
jgi:hypothetical protein